MSPATRQCDLARARLDLARARLLRQIARDDALLADVLTFARSVGDPTTSDTLAAFRCAQTEAIRAARAALTRLATAAP